MKFKCEKSVLLDAVRAASSAVTSVNLPVEQNIRFSLEGKELTIVGNDPTITIQTTLAVDGQEDGKLCLPSKVTVDVLAALAQHPDAGAITISDTDSVDNANLDLDEEENIVDQNLSSAARPGPSVVVSAGNTMFTLHQLPAGDFSSLSVGQKASKTEMEAADFLKALGQVIGMASQNPSRPVLNGVLIAAEETNKTKFMRLVASDTFRLGLRDLEGVEFPKGTSPKGTSNEGSVLVPVSSLERLRSLASNTEKITLTVEETQVAFEFDDTTLITQLLPGDFPDYKKLLPEDYPDKLSLNKQEVLGVLARVAVMARDNDNQLIKADLKKDGVEFSAVDKTKGTAVENIDAEFKGEETSIGFNANYLENALKALEDDKFTVTLNGALKPVFIQGEKTENFRCLIMPVRLSS